MEREVYVDKISLEYKVSKDAIYAEINKILFANNKSENPGYAPRNCDQLALHILKFYVQKFQNENAWPDFMGWAGFITKEEMLKKMAEINAANIIKNDVDGIEYLKKAY